MRVSLTPRMFVPGTAAGRRLTREQYSGVVAGLDRDRVVIRWDEPRDGGPPSFLSQGGDGCRIIQTARDCAGGLGPARASAHCTQHREWWNAVGGATATNDSGARLDVMMEAGRVRGATGLRLEGGGRIAEAVVAAAKARQPPAAPLMLCPAPTAMDTPAPPPGPTPDPAP
eukprot:gene24556-64278_t